MKMAFGGCLAVVAMTTLLNAQKSTVPEPEKPLVLTGSIPLDGVKGRFDHFGYGGGRLFVAAVGNNSVEAINVGGRTVDHTIKVSDPAGVAFAHEANKLFVSSGEGKVYIYDGTSLDPVTFIDFQGGADNLRYDAANKRVYVACGENETGAIATIDEINNKRLDEVYKLGASPESFQLETSGPNIYVNLPDLKQIAVINRSTKAISRWPLSAVEHNFPMALDEANHRLFVGTHVPPRLAVFDTISGRMIAALPSVQDSDDLYYDSGRKRIYMVGGEGFVSVFQQNNPDHYQLLAKVPTGIGARTAGYFGKGRKGFDRLYVVVPARAGQGAEVLIYTVQD
jgi:YVTN family beta-propeller protein